MSILIKGMEMPKTCGKCQIKNAIECNRWKLVRSVVLDRHRDCPLVPAADVRPVVRGKWIVSRTDYGWNCVEFPTHCKCTVCGREVPYQDKDNYCPSCGADMREES